MAFGCPAELECTSGPESCACPKGCSGKDDWEHFESSCHVNNSVRFTLHFIVLVLSLMVVVMAWVSLVVLSRKKYGVWWRLQRYIRKCFPRKEEAKSVVVLEPQMPSFSLSSDDETQPRRSIHTGMDTKQSRVKRHQIQLQALLSFWLVFLFFNFGFCFTLYEFISLFGDNYRFDDTPVARFLDFLVATGSSSCLLGLWAIAYKWYDLLPSVARYGRILKFNSFVVHYPNAFFWWVKGWAVLSFLFVQLFFFIMPAANPNDRKSFDFAAVFSMTFITIIWWISMVFITTLLNRVYEEAKKAMTGYSPMPPSSYRLSDAGSGRKEASPTETSLDYDASTDFTAGTDPATTARDRFETTMRCVLIMSTLGAAGAVITMLSIALSPVLRRNMYVISSTVAIIGNLVALFLMYFVIVRPTLERMPRRVATNPSRCLPHVS